MSGKCEVRKFAWSFSVGHYSCALVLPINPMARTSSSRICCASLGELELHHTYHPCRCECCWRSHSHHGILVQTVALSPFLLKHLLVKFRQTCLRSRRPWCIGCSSFPSTIGAWAQGAGQAINDSRNANHCSSLISTPRHYGHPIYCNSLSM